MTLSLINCSGCGSSQLWLKSSLVLWPGTQTCQHGHCLSFGVNAILLIWQMFKNRHLQEGRQINSRITCPVEPGHVHHCFVVSQLHIFLCYYQLDFIPFLWLKNTNRTALGGMSTDGNKIMCGSVGKRTISNHWCTATATCVPSGFVKTNTSPGTALSGLEEGWRVRAKWNIDIIVWYRITLNQASTKERTWTK